METRYRLEARGLSCKLISNSLQERVFSSFSKSSCKYILQDVSCEAMPGEITAIAGPSGAGKTTLLEILAGKVRPRAVSGHVMVNNKQMDCKRFRRISGYVTQEDALFPSLTVQETLMYSAFLRLRVRKDEALLKVKRLMNELGLDHVASSRIGEGMNHWDSISRSYADQLASDGLFDVHVRATGDVHIDDHHKNEDVALAIGTALLQALGDRKGINRFGDFSAPLDEALIHVALDLSGRPYLGYNLEIPTQRVGSYDTQLAEHFFQSLVNTSGMTLHIRQLAGRNSHHIIEATFKAFARASLAASD